MTSAHPQDSPLTPSLVSPGGVPAESVTQSCDHHWVSAHQADFPPGIRWVRQCSQCQRIDGADLTIQMDKAIRTVMLSVEMPEGGA